MTDEPTTWTDAELDAMSGRKFTNDGKPIYKLTTFQLLAAHQKLEPLSKAATKIGTTPIELNILSTYDVTHKDYDTGLDKVTTYHEVTVSGDVPRINGWLFVARVEHSELGNIIAIAPSMDGLVDTTQYRSTYQKCDHCEQYRQRKDTYLVVRRFPKGLVRDASVTPNVWYDSDGDEFTFDLMQVGSSCLKDFLGHGDPNTIVRYMEMMHSFLHELASDDDSDMRFGGGDGGEPMYVTTSFLAHVAAMVRTHGWMPKGKAIDSGQLSTVERVWDNIDRIEHPRKNVRHYEPPVVPTDADANEAKLAHEWLTSHLGSIPTEQRNDFQQNLYVAAGGKSFERRNAGFVACVIDQYHRAISAKLERERVKRTNEYFGEIGDRLKLTLTVTYVFERASSFGPSFKHIFLNNSGHTFTWSTGTVELERGGKYVIVGTVKEHTEYKDTKQTVLTRCKVMERKEQ